MHNYPIKFLEILTTKLYKISFFLWTYEPEKATKNFGQRHAIDFTELEKVKNRIATTEKYKKLFFSS